MRNKPPFLGYVILWSVAIGVGGALIGTSVGLFINYLVIARMNSSIPLPSEWLIYTKFFAPAFFGAFLIFGLFWRIVLWESFNKHENGKQ